MTKQENLLGKGARVESSRVKEPVAPSLGFMVMGFVSWLSLACHLARSMFVLTQGPPYWQVYPSAKMDSSAEDSGRFTRHFMSWPLSLLLVPPRFSQLVFGSSTMFLVQASCCETARAGGPHRACRGRRLWSTVPWHWCVTDTPEVSLSLDFLGPTLADNLLLLKPLRARPCSTLESWWIFIPHLF